MMTVPSVPIQEFLTDQFKIRGKTLDYLQEIILRIHQLKNEIAEIEKAIIDIELKPRCCGVFYEDSKGFVYANHGIDDNCPLHGRHPTAPGEKRVRKYIGKKEKHITKFKAALKQWQKWRKEKQKLIEKERELKQIIDKLKVTNEVAQGRRGWGY